MTQHVRVRLDRKFGPGGGSIDHAREASRSKWSTALGREHEGRLRLLLTMQPPEGAQFVAHDRMRAGRALLTLRTCRAAVRKSICSQRRSTSSDTRRPCL